MTCNSTVEVSDTSWTEVVLVVCYLSIFSVAGSIGNLLVLYVFARKKDALVSTLFILVLAEVDFTTCLVVVPYTAYMEYVDFRTDVDLVCKLYLFLITFNIPFSALIMVAIAIDRYLCICHPFLRVMNIGRAKFLIAALGLLAAGQGICVSLIYGVYLPADKTCLADVHTVGDAIVNTGHCQPNELVISNEFQWYYQKFYTAMYPACLTIVVILYILIYRSVLARRNLRLLEKRKSLAIVQSLTAAVRAGRNQRQNSQTEHTLVPCYDELEMRRDPALGRNQSTNRRASRIDMNRLANLKTAAMLFVVTVIFVITFLPAFLMALELVPYNAIVFYFYFANNVANPVIYSFMNKNFRADLTRFFCLRR